MKKWAAGAKIMTLGKEDIVERVVLAGEREEEPLVYRDVEVDLNKVRPGGKYGKGSKRF